MSVRTERYVVRPYVGLTHLEEALAEVSLRLGKAEMAPGSNVVPEGTLANAELSLRLPFTAESLRESLESTKLPDVDCALVVIASGITHRTSEIVFRHMLHYPALPDEIAINRDMAPLIFEDRAGFELGVYLALVHELQPEPLRPHMAGTWLSRRTFRVVPEKDDSSFSPQRLTADMRLTLGVPPEALSYVLVEESLLTDDLADSVTVYLDEETLNLLLQDPTEPFALQIQIELATTTLTVVAKAFLQSLSENSAGDVSETQLHLSEPATNFFNSLARLTSQPVEKVLTQAKNPDLLRAAVQSAFGLRTATARALKES